MKKQKILGYMFDCHEFIYNNRRITGLCCSIKINNKISEAEINESVAIQLSKKNGFTILLNSKAQNIIVQPYKIYALALCENSEEELLEIKTDVLIQNECCIIEDINSSAESIWSINEG